MSLHANDQLSASGPLVDMLRGGLHSLHQETIGVDFELAGVICPLKGDEMRQCTDSAILVFPAYPNISEPIVCFCGNIRLLVLTKSRW